MFAQATDYTVHADDSGDTSIGYVTNTYTLVDEDGNTLVDMDGNILITEDEEAVYGTLIYAKGTDYTVHAED